MKTITDNMTPEDIAQLARGESEPTTAVAVAQPTQQPPSLIAVIAQAVERGVDPDHLGKLLDLQERYEAGRAKSAFTRALTAAQADMPPVFKDGQNSFNKTRYATLENVLNTVRPVYLKHGFSITFGQDPTCPTPGLIRLFVDVSHAEGHTERYYGDFPVDDAGTKGGSNKSAIQAIGSAFSYGRRYLMGLVFNLVFTNEDNDGQPIQSPPQQQQQPTRPNDDHEKITPEQRERIKNLLKVHNRDMDRFLDWAGAISLIDVTRGKYRSMCKMLNEVP